MEVGAQADDGAQLVVPLHHVLPVQADAALIHPVLARRGEPLPLARGIQADAADAGDARLQAEGVFHVVSAPLSVPGVAGLEAENPAPVGLLELVAVRRIVEEVGEIGEEIQPVVDGVGAGARLPRCIAARPLRRQ